MTPEAAIALLDGKSLLILARSNGKTHMLNTAKETAIAALEKQIEIEPVIEVKQGMTFRKCPKCGRVLFSDAYCGDCGQKVKKAVK